MPNYIMSLAYFTVVQFEGLTVGPIQATAGYTPMTRITAGAAPEHPLGMTLRSGWNQHHVHLPLARTVQLDQHHRLPGTKYQFSG